MPYGLYISAEGALAQSQRMEVIANNLANVDTVAFKRDLAIFQSRLAEATERGEDAPGSGSLNDLGGGIRLVGTATDYSQAALKRTDGVMDLALEGPGFFVVRREGQDLLTRAGNFDLNSSGALIAPGGDPVIAADGNPILIDPSLPWQWSSDGAIEQGGEIVPLAIVAPRALGDLVKVGENFFHSLGPVVPVLPPDRRVAVGFLESSGVDPTTEMMSLIETSRAFEANVSLIRSQDQLLGTLVSRVLRTT